MKCNVYDREVMGSNPSRVEFGVRNATVYSTLTFSFAEIVQSFGSLPARTDQKWLNEGTAFIIGTVGTDVLPGRLFALEAFIRLANPFWIQVWRRTYNEDNLAEFLLISQWEYTSSTSDEYQSVVVSTSCYHPVIQVLVLALHTTDYFRHRLPVCLVGGKEPDLPVYYQSAKIIQNDHRK